MCDMKFSIYLYSVHFGIRSIVCGYAGWLYVSYAIQSLGFSVKQVFKEVFGNSSLCGSRKYPYPSHRGFFNFIPPTPWNFRDFPTRLPFPLKRPVSQKIYICIYKTRNTCCFIAHIYLLL